LLASLKVVFLPKTYHFERFTLLSGVEFFPRLTDVLEQLVSGRTKAYELKRHHYREAGGPSSLLLLSMPECRDGQATLAKYDQYESLCCPGRHRGRGTEPTEVGRRGCADPTPVRGQDW
jgi:hypothetical protein